MPAMSCRAALLFLIVACLPACSGSEAAAAAKQPAPGHVAATLKLDDDPYCDSCVHRVTKAIDWLPGVSAVDVKVGDPNIRVWHDPSSVTDAKIGRASCRERVYHPV